jgi:hypothetical protein
VDHPEDEDVVVRQYRFLLRTAPVDALEAAHAEALDGLGVEPRAAVLRAVQTGLVAGLRLQCHQIRELSHLLTLGERRTPGAVLSTLEPHALRALAERVVLAEAAFGLFGGYAAWDGAEPVTLQERWTDAGFGEPWHDSLVTRVVYRNFVGGPSSPDAAFGGH